MTNVFLTQDWIRGMANFPPPDVAEFRFPFTDDDKALFFLPAPNQHVQVVVYPSPSCTMLGAAIVKEKLHPFVVENDGVSYQRAMSEKHKRSLSRVCAWVLHTINEMNRARVKIEPADFVSGRERRLAKSFGSQSFNVCYRIAPLNNHIPIAEAECRETGIKQRHHMRRGHYRQLKTGKSVWVNAYWAGDKEIGIVHKDYTTAKDTTHDK